MAHPTYSFAPAVWDQPVAFPEARPRRRHMPILCTRQQNKEGTVTITATTPSGAATFSADFALVTVPLGDLMRTMGWLFFPTTSELPYP